MNKLAELINNKKVDEVLVQEENTLVITSWKTECGGVKALAKEIEASGEFKTEIFVYGDYQAINVMINHDNAVVAVFEEEIFNNNLDSIKEADDAMVDYCFEQGINYNDTLKRVASRLEQIVNEAMDDLIFTIKNGDSLEMCHDSFEIDSSVVTECVLNIGGIFEEDYTIFDYIEDTCTNTLYNEIIGYMDDYCVGRDLLTIKVDYINEHFAQVELTTHAGNEMFGFTETLIFEK